MKRSRGSSIVDIGRSVSGWAMKLEQRESATGPKPQKGSGEESLLGDALQHGPRLENKGRQHYPTQVCTRSELGNDMRQD